MEISHRVDMLIFIYSKAQLQWEFMAATQAEVNWVVREKVSV